MSNLQFPLDRPPIILAVDTSQPNASFAISCGTKIIASLQGEDSAPHSEVFFNLLSLLLKDAGLALAEVDLLAAAVGPGSFTGLRVGLSAIKGLSHSLGKQAIGISSIDATALTSGVAGKVLVLIDAGREELYAGLREISMDKILIPVGDDMVGKLPEVILSFSKHIMGDRLIIVRQGDSRNKAFDLSFNDLLNWQLVTTTSTSAEEIALYVNKTFNGQPGLGLYPYYIRPSDAEMKRV